MNITEELLPNSYLIFGFGSNDFRGRFFKTFNTNFFDEVGIKIEIAELFHSVSKRDVVRGMHFQSPPHDHAKLVTCVSGSILDVLLDLRLGKSYGKFVARELCESRPEILYIPPGIAHGFLSTSENSIVSYATSSVHHAHLDNGIRYDSFGFNWPVTSPTISERDLKLPIFSEFATPF